VAFALDPNRIYLNLKKKFPRGRIDSSDKKELKQEIAEKLLKLEYEGRKVIRHVFKAEEIYHGKYTCRGPDLVAVSEPGFDLKGSIRKKEIFGRSHLQGCTPGTTPSSGQWKSTDQTWPLKPGQPHHQKD